MGANSKIEWTDHTQNFWIGCRKVSPACTHCYAGTLVENRMGKPFYPGPTPGRVASDADSPVWRTKTWGEPLKWQKEAAAGVVKRVFTCSLSDFFLDHPSVHEWRRDAWKVIRDTPNLLWLVLSKRYDHGLEYILSCLPDDWGTGYPNVMLGATVENQETTSRLDVACQISTVRGIFASCEPLLGQIDLRPYFAGVPSPVRWVIGGGESGGKARPTHPEWARTLRDDICEAGGDFNWKQWGEWVTEEQAPNDIVLPSRSHLPWAIECRDLDGRVDDIEGDLTAVYKTGKKAAGRMLDGRTWDERPV